MSKTKLLLAKRNLLSKLLSFFSLSAAAFVVQACYGTAEGYEDATRIDGRVTALDSGESIRGIKVDLNGSQQKVFTDEQGRYSVLCDNKDSYRLVFSDVDGEENGMFLPGEKVVDNKDFNFRLHADFALERQDQEKK